MRSSYGSVVAPERRMSSWLITVIAAGESPIRCARLETLVTST
jgi:hypothetical protein